VAILPRPRLVTLAGSRGFFGDETNDDSASGAGACSRSTLASMYASLAPKVHRFLCDLLGDAVLAADATQETFVRAFHKVEDLPPGTRLVPWIFGVARFVSLEMRKARGRIRRVITSETVDEGVHTADDATRSPEAELLDREALVVVEGALRLLPEARRAAFLLRLDHGFSYDEIAIALGWSLPKVKIEIFRAREALRRTFDAYRGGEP
jgi:RNA polymerase sigma-70 factor (ECF subfamily)